MHSITHSTSDNFSPSSRKSYTLRSKAQWQSLLQQFEEGDLSQKAFCKQHSITPSSFYLWRKRLSAESVMDTPSDFINLSDALDADNSNPEPSLADVRWQVELTLGKATVLRIRTV
jgi:putative transposase